MTKKSRNEQKKNSSTKKASGWTRKPAVKPSRKPGVDRTTTTMIAEDTKQQEAAQTNLLTTFRKSQQDVQRHHYLFAVNRLPVLHGMALERTWEREMTQRRRVIPFHPNVLSVYAFIPIKKVKKGYRAGIICQGASFRLYDVLFSWTGRAGRPKPIPLYLRWALAQDVLSGLLHIMHHAKEPIRLHISPQTIFVCIPSSLLLFLPDVIFAWS